MKLFVIIGRLVVSFVIACIFSFVTVFVLAFIMESTNKIQSFEPFVQLLLLLIIFYTVLIFIYTKRFKK